MTARLAAHRRLPRLVDREIERACAGVDEIVERIALRPLRRHCGLAPCAILAQDFGLSRTPRHDPAATRRRIGVLRLEGRMRDRREQVARVLRLRREQHPLGRPLLDDLPRLHDDHAVAQQPHHVEVVRDEQIAHAERLLEVLQQVEHHRLHRDVERRGRLVEDDEIGLERDRARDADARLLPAGKLVRKAVEQFDRQADLPRQLLAARAHGVAAPARRRAAGSDRRWRAPR